MKPKKKITRTMQTLFCRARMVHLRDHHSVRPSQESVHTLEERGDEEMPDEKERTIDDNEPV